MRVCIQVLVLGLVVSLSPSMGYAKGQGKALSPFMQKQLVKVNTLMETESWDAARDALLNLESDSNSSYLEALLALSLGQVDIYLEDYQRALSYFRRAYDLRSLSPAQNHQLLHNIAQLQCSLDEWSNCIRDMSSWISMLPDQAKAEDYLMLAQAYSMTEQWEQVILPVNKAIGLRSNAPLSWLQLRVVAFAQLERWKRAISHQEALLLDFSEEANEWRRLVSFYMQIENYQQAASSMRLAYEMDLLTSASDCRQLAQLLGQNNLPYYGAVILEECLAKGYVQRDARHLSFLASLWLRAKEDAQAIRVYQELVRIEPKRSWFKRLANLHYQQGNWTSASDLLLELLEREEDTNLRLLLSVSLVNQDNFASARQELHKLAKDHDYKSIAESWLTYIDELSKLS